MKNNFHAFFFFFFIFLLLSQLASARFPPYKQGKTHFQKLFLFHSNFQFYFPSDFPGKFAGQAETQKKLSHGIAQENSWPEDFSYVIKRDFFFCLLFFFFVIWILMGLFCFSSVDDGRKREGRRWRRWRMGEEKNDATSTLGLCLHTDWKPLNLILKICLCTYPKY